MDIFDVTRTSGSERAVTVRQLVTNPHSLRTGTLVTVASSLANGGEAFDLAIETPEGTRKWWPEVMMGDYVAVDETSDGIEPTALLRANEYIKIDSDEPKPARRRDPGGVTINVRDLQYGMRLVGRDGFVTYVRDREDGFIEVGMRDNTYQYLVISESTNLVAYPAGLHETDTDKPEVDMNDHSSWVVGPAASVAIGDTIVGFGKVTSGRHASFKITFWRADGRAVKFDRDAEVYHIKG